MVVFFFLSDYKIGLTHLLLEQALHLKKLKSIDFSFISGDDEQVNGLKDKALSNGISIDYIKGLDVHNDFFHLAKKFLELVNINSPEFVHVQNNWQLAIVAFVKFFYFKKYKIVYTIHSYRHNYPIRSQITKVILSLALLLLTEKVVVPSSFMRKKFSLIKFKTYTIFLGVDDSFFKIDASSKAYIDNNIVFAGQFRGGKNQELIIRVAKNLYDQSNRNFKIFLAGDGPNLASCKKIVQELDLADLVVFTGNLCRSELLSLYEKCQIAIVATNIETFGHCIAEPYVLGLCTISRRTGIAEDIILNGYNGLLFEKDEELLSLLQKVIGKDAEKRKIGRAAFKNRNILKWDNNINKYLDIYN